MSKGGPRGDPAQERIGEILRRAVPLPDEAALEDETRRIMLHLSVEPVPSPPTKPPAAAAAAVHAPAEPKPSRLRQWITDRKARKG